jgi:hypothetical protein
VFGGLDGVVGVVFVQVVWQQQQQLKQENKLKKQQNMGVTLLGDMTEVRYMTLVTKSQWQRGLFSHVSPIKPQCLRS